jgi:GT2 family glycosyltransferase/glycosyltransferase involved in cell wall biosynthesis
LETEGYRVLIARRAAFMAYAFSLTAWGTDEALHYTRADGIDSLCADILTLAPAFIHIHHLIDLPDGLDRFVRASGIPYYVTLHDYFYLCPRVTLLDDGGRYSGLPDARGCNNCLRRGGAHRDMDHTYKHVWPDITRWRDKWHDLLNGACAVIAPDQAVADLYGRSFTGLPLAVRPHQGPAEATVRTEPRTLPGEIRVALIGGLMAHKGVDAVLAMMRWAEKYDPTLRFILIGYSDQRETLRAFANFEDHGPYDAGDLSAKLAAAGCHVALFLSPWPETYSYTLSEALRHGLTPVVSDLGAPARRVKALGAGVVVPVDVAPAALAVALRDAAAVRVLSGSYSEGEYGPLVQDYYRLDKVSDTRRVDTLLLANARGVHGDAWTGQQVVLDFASRTPVNRLKVELTVPGSFGPQQVEVRIGGESYGRIALGDNNALRRLDIAMRPMTGLIRVELIFSFAYPLPAPDDRMVAARIEAAAVLRDDSPVLEVRPNPLSIRLRPSPDAGHASALQTMDMAGDPGVPALPAPPVPLPSAAKGLAKDLLWSARLLRREGAKSAVKSFLAMRYLRHSPFNDAFYRAQLGPAERRWMDPVNHYVVFGAREGLDPAPGFSTHFYLTAHGDLARAGVNPYFHFLRHGADENRRSEPSVHAQLLSDPEAYARRSSGWPRRDRPKDAARFGPQDVRPDDDVLVTARDGETFLERHGLLGKVPKWEESVRALNALPRPSLSETPDVSIIIPVYGQLAYTLNCLHSLLPHAAHHSFEILLADDCSPDDSETWLKQVEGIRYIRYPQNEGFIATCNKTAEQACGKFLIFLNNDTRVGDFWVDRLTESFSHFPEAGLIGSKLFYPDGALQEAGGIVWKDGSAWNYGRNDDPNRPAYCYARQVDYVSGAAFIIPTDLWRRLDGFDARYKPAYYEDTDLAFRVREAGHAVVMQPLSKVVHYEGRTSGTDTSGGAKAYQVINKSRFFARWERTLQNHRGQGERPELERDRTVAKRVLVIDACNPTPGKDAGSKATVDLMQYYRQLGYHVSFVPEDNFLYQRDEVSALQAMGIECIYGPFEFSMTRLLEANGALYDVIHVIRADVGFKNLDLIRRLAPRAKFFYLNADLHFLRLQRQAWVENKPALLEAAEAMKDKEFALTRACDVTFVHSTVERDILEAEVSGAVVRVLPLTERLSAPQAAPAERHDIMFLGGYNHPPNVDAALWLLDDIWPQIAEKLPEARLLLVGANPPEALTKRASERIIVTGQVSELTPWFEQARLFVAPLRYGAGVKGKVLAALAHGVPVVASDMAVEGMSLKDGKTVFVASTADDIAAELLRLYKADATAWKRHSRAAQAYINDHHSFEAATLVLQSALEE